MDAMLDKTCIEIMGDILAAQDRIRKLKHDPLVKTHEVGILNAAMLALESAHDILNHI